MKYLVIIIVLLGFYACEESENETLISKNFDTKSHNAGKNCMDCHKKGGDGEGWFTVAGTVYNAAKTDISANGKIQVFSDQNKQDLLLEIEVDAKGNFYTTESLSIENGVYLSAMNTSGVKEDMSTSTTSGACNVCHDETMRIYVN